MECEIRSWLKQVLDENLDNYSINILGNSEKGDGYVGDIVFVSLEPQKDTKRYDLVLKCSKRSQALREKAPVREAFLNEIKFYQEVLPAFKKFQLARGVNDGFDGVPKCFGSLVTDDMEIIVFQNLKSIGYSLWDKKKPLSRKYLDAVLEQYAKYHAVSFAMNDQEPKKYQKLTKATDDIFKQFLETSDGQVLFGTVIDEICEILKNELDQTTLEKLKNLKNKIQYIVADMLDEIQTEVYLHGDCWNNNFMFKHDLQNLVVPKDVCLLDFQISRNSSPVLDLSYFLFATISKEDIKQMDKILDQYYQNLLTCTKRLGSNLLKLYSKEKFLDEWKRYSQFGIILACLIFKIVVTEKDEVIDLSHASDTNDVFVTAFGYDVKNKEAFKNRAKHVVTYVVENGLF